MPRGRRRLPIDPTTAPLGKVHVRRAVSLRAHVYEAAAALAEDEGIAVSALVEGLVLARAEEIGVEVPDDEEAKARLRAQRVASGLRAIERAAESARRVGW